MQIEENFVIGSVYDVVIVPVGIIKSPGRAVFSGLIDYNMAVKLAPVNTLHAATYHLLPQGTSTDPSRLTYCVFTSNENTIVLATAWINKEATKLVEKTQANVTIYGISESNFNHLRSTLQKAGYQVGSITIG